MKFNTNAQNTHKTKNLAGGDAFMLSKEWELYAGVVTASLNDQFYEKANDRLDRMTKLIAETDAEFVAKLAVYARTDMYMRSIPMVLAVELAKKAQGTDLVSRTVAKVVQRADEITELLAYYQMTNKRSGTKKLNRLSKQIQKGLGTAFNQFDEYQFAKYNRAGEVSLKDALFLVHPKAKNEAQQALFHKIVSDSLQTPYTWETELSALGQVSYISEKAKTVAFTAKWEELIDSGKLGYMALLRNLRNILEANVSTQHIQKVCNVLSDAKAVAKAKQFPFRFLAAFREIKDLKSGAVTMVLNALEKAVVASVVNMKGFDADTKVLVAADVSGSMQVPISAKSKVLSYDIGLMLAMLLQSKCNHVVSGMFGDKWKIINVPNQGILQNVEAFYRREGEVGYSTNGHLVIQDLIYRKVIMDKVMIFTDCQMYNSHGGNANLQNTWTKYKAIAPNAKLYLFNLAGHGALPIDLRKEDVYLIAGWSDKIFDVLAAIENGSDALAKIKAVEL